MTNPTLSPTNKLIQALTHCKAALLGLCHLTADNKGHNLQELITNTQSKLAVNATSSIDPPRVPTQPVTPDKVPRTLEKDKTYGSFPKPFQQHCVYPKSTVYELDISNFYLMTPLRCPEYICIKLSDLPNKIIHEYQLNDKYTNNGMIFIAVTKGMYRLLQSGLLANELLKKHINQHGYVQSKLVPGLWCQRTCPIQFVLTVNDFGVKYVGCQHAKHWYTVICKHYQVTTDWARERFIGIHL
eukprot:CCRYP_007641-RA/>CCRYP_007641-RA protein AED:0.40 eAED:0.40 QI:0/0/0/1/0/0/2/0/241